MQKPSIAWTYDLAKDPPPPPSLLANLGVARPLPTGTHHLSFPLNHSKEGEGILESPMII